MSNQFAIILSIIILSLDVLMIVATYVSRKITLRRKKRLLDIERDIVLRFHMNILTSHCFDQKIFLKCTQN